MADVDRPPLPGSEYMVFQLVHEDDAYERKTKVVMVTSKSRGQLLARISWYGAWRQYVLIPARQTIFNRACLEEISALLEHLMAERRIARQPALPPARRYPRAAAPPLSTGTRRDENTHKSAPAEATS